LEPQQHLSGSLNQKLNLPMTLIELQTKPGQGKMQTVFLIIMLTIKLGQLSPIPMAISGQLLTTKELNTEEHQIIFRRLREYAINVIFHHIHTPVSLSKINQVSDKTIEKI
jgi:hypothetical protein